MATRACASGFNELDEALSEVDLDFPDIRDLGDRVAALGRMRSRGRASGAVLEVPLGYLTDYRNGKMIRVRAYLDLKEFLEDAGLSE